jgi:hypothetical protein
MAEKKDPQQPQVPKRDPAPPDAASLPVGVTPPAFTPRAEDGNKGTVSFARRESVDEKQGQLWDAIRVHTDQIGFTQFAEFIRLAFCRENDRPSPEVTAFRNAAGADFQPNGRFGSGTRSNPLGCFIPGADLYGALKLASEIFLLLRCGICRPPLTNPTVISATGDSDDFHIGDGGLTADEINALYVRLTTFLGSDRASYIHSILENVFSGRSFKASPFCAASVGLGPCLMELIWSYWHEQAMLVQTTNAIALRFQNVARNGRDPLAEFELDPLRPLSGFLWGYVRDEPARLSVARRAYEYHHEYGLSLAGRAAARVRPVDSRSKFLQGFHDLLRLTDQFYREASDNTVTPDAFPLLIALRDLHMILADGAHNQFRDLPWTARSEMLVQQWLLARDETRDFLRGRFMTPYPEGWMGAVDAMKRLQGWSDTSVIHFSDLARFGERLLLSVRHVRWDVVADPFAAQDWALAWRPEIQGYIHAYRMVTGIMLADDIVELNRADSPRYIQPSALLQNRLIQQRRSTGALAAGAGQRAVMPSRTRSLPKP